MTLRDVIENAKLYGYSLDDLTVLALQNDPYRVDTPAGHRDAAWCRDQVDYALSSSGKSRIHLRGLHYSIVAHGGILKPDCKPYKNNEPDWRWLQNAPAKAARWLGYVPFTAIVDQRNSPPIIHRKEREDVYTWISTGVEVEIPDASDLHPRASVTGFVGRQPYHLVIFGEKSSLEDVVVPIAERLNMDVYLPTGEISDTLLYQMAADGNEDGRPMRVFTLSDFDPSGWQMPISISRKLQAFRDLEFPDLDFEVRPVAMTEDQVRTLGLPSSPLKESKKRKGKWWDAFQLEQTEIDALATLRSTELERVIEEALDTFYDHDLDDRVSDAETEWLEEANEMLEEQLDPEMLDKLREDAAEKLSQVQEEIQKINDVLRVASDGVGLPIGLSRPRH